MNEEKEKDGVVIAGTTVLGKELFVREIRGGRAIMTTERDKALTWTADEVNSEEKVKELARAFRSPLREEDIAGPYEYKNQHLVLEAYMAEWCDPSTPEGQTPYVHRIDVKDPTKTKKRSPNKTFSENNRYTVTLPDGTRDVTIEKVLSNIEGVFFTTRERIKKGEPLTVEDKTHLCLFAAAMATRSKKQGEHHRSTWQRVHEQIKNLEKVHGVDPHDMPPLEELGKGAINSLETARIVKEAHTDLIRFLVPDMTEILGWAYDMQIFETDDELGFITSDSPFVMFNPNTPHPGLLIEGTEIMLPLTPRFALFGKRKSVPTLDISSFGYLKVGRKIVDEFNRMVRVYAGEEIISLTGKTRPYWFVDDPRKVAPTWGYL